MHQPHIVIIGAGIVGLSTAYALLKQGIRRVTVLEQAQVNHQRGASYGPSRLLRHEYGSDRLYTEMVHLSLKRWKNLERETHKTLYAPTGVLTLGREDDGSTNTSYYMLRELGFTPEWLTPQECRRRFPQFRTQGYTMLTYNANAGLLHASRCMQTLRGRILDLGGTILENSRIVRIIHDSRNNPVHLLLKDSGEIAAEKVILATGPWVHHLLGEMRLPVRLTRQYSLYFANLSPEIFGVGVFPAFMANDLYGFPILPIGTTSGPPLLKAASHRFGMATEPDEEPVIDEEVIRREKEALSDLIPALQKAKLTRIVSCIYDISPDETFILDHLPDDPRIIFATGLSGHGFKFGLLLGEMLSNLVCEREPVVPLERFRLARFEQISVQKPSVV